MYANLVRIISLRNFPPTYRKIPKYPPSERGFILMPLNNNNPFVVYKANHFIFTMMVDVVFFYKMSIERINYDEK